MARERGYAHEQRFAAPLFGNELVFRELVAYAVRIGAVELFRNGVPHDERAPEAADYLTRNEIDLEVDMGTGGNGTSLMWTCDLSAEYVRINAEYRT